MYGSIPKSEYPRPDFARENWLCLNGTWQFAYDDENCGISEKWYLNHEYDQEILVPFTFETEASGIGNPTAHDIVWYEREVDICEDLLTEHLFLNFGAVDFQCDIWVNGQRAGRHTGGYSSFEFDITDLAQAGPNRITVRCYDSMRDRAQPRGKQSWQETNFACWYERATGIWQSVWLQSKPELFVERVKMTPTRSSQIEMEVFLSGMPSEMVDFQAVITYEGHPVTTVSASSMLRSFKISADVRDPNCYHDVHRWRPDNPCLYDVTFTLWYGQQEDVVKSYFGMRVISTHNGQVTFDDSPCYLRMVLDQGYYLKGGITAESDDALRKDVELIKALGFNGVRKHQKVEDPRFLYWADKLGLIVFGEMGSAFEFNDRMMQYNYGEWMEEIKRDYNHPCIIGWTLINESWGVEEIFRDKSQQAHCDALYHMARSFDPMRLLVANDGWETTRTDLINFHDYNQDYKSLLKNYPGREALSDRTVSNGWKYMFAQGYKDEGQPIIYSELAGTGFTGAETWGYGNTVRDEEEYLQRYRELMTAVYGMPFVAGFVITQITDVRQEGNGLLFMDRTPKCDIAAMSAIIRGEDLIKE